jgi:D-3-phosphoglycerate dehydrogenase / 2-oxoglutarate reductase
VSTPYRIVATSAGQHWDIEVAAARAGRVEFSVLACHTEADLIAAGQEADAILAGNESFTRRVIEGFSHRVRVISRPAVGYDQVDVAAATARGIVVTHVPDYCTDEVSDHAFALLLALHRRVSWLNAAIKAGRWGQATVYGGDRPAAFHAGEVPGPLLPLRGQTLGIIGFGRIGQRLAEKARGFGLRLLATDPFVAPAVGEPLGVTLTDLNTLLHEADFVSIHCLLNAGTQGLIGAPQLALMKPTAQLVNTARGPIVDLTALTATLQKGQLAAAALDVTEPEPLPTDHPLMTLPNVLLTPHSAYYSDRSRAEVRRRGVENALAVLRGATPNHAANPEVLAQTGAAAVAAGDQ